MAKPGRKQLRRGCVTRPVMFYVTAEEYRQMERHAADNKSAWVRRLVAAELGRLAARE